MDKRIKYRMVLDTETAPLDNTLNTVEANNMFVYDIGWAIVDKTGKVYETKSFVVAEIYIGEKDLMKSAYYSNKLPQYEKDIKNGKRILKSLLNIRKEMFSDMEKYGITTEIYAHNERFDRITLNNTIRWVTKSKTRYFFPYGVNTLNDTMVMSKDILSNRPTYKRFCQNNNFMTKHKIPQVQLKAETIFAYITDNPNFIESHTALEDVLIEKDIMAYCFKQHKKMRKHY